MSPCAVLSACLAACLLPAVLSQKPGMNRHQLALKEHYEHLAMIAEFECGTPQPRLMMVQELLPMSQTAGKAYFPEVTVLHRCDRHVGSCNDATHHCGPTLATTVKMPFKVTFLEEMDGHAKGEWEMEYHSLENHTECGCLKFDGPQKPSKTAVHYHYIDPSLMPPQTFLPLDSHTQKPQENISSYDVPLYQLNNTVTPSRNETDPSYETRPSIYDMTKLAEEEVERESDKEVKPIPDEDEVQAKPEEGNTCPACIESQGHPGHPGESSTANEVRDPSSTPQSPSLIDEETDNDATTIPSELIRFGAEDSPRSEALTHVDSPYDAYLKQS